MSRRDPSVCLRHMLDHAREAVEMAEGTLRSILREAGIGVDDFLKA